MAKSSAVAVTWSSGVGAGRSRVLNLHTIGDGFHRTRLALVPAFEPCKQGWKNKANRGGLGWSCRDKIRSNTYGKTTAGSTFGGSRFSVTLVKHTTESIQAVQARSYRHKRVGERLENEGNHKTQVLANSPGLVLAAWPEIDTSTEDM